MKIRTSGGAALGSMARRQAMTALLTGGAAWAIATRSSAAPSERSMRGDKGGKASRQRWTSSFLLLDPVQRFRQAMRIQRSLYDEDLILHWDHFIMIAVPVGMTPRPVVRWEGIELSLHRLLADNRYRLHGHNLSFPRDLTTGAFVSEVLNPVSKRRVAVPPLARMEDPGLVRSPAGVVTLDRPNTPPRPDYKVLRREGNFVKVDAIRVPPDTWPVTFLEMGYEQTDARLFDDPKNLWLPSEVSGAYVFPWPKWMQMGDAPGHMFAAWSGYKLRSTDELPDEFRQRAEKEYPQLLTVDPQQFSKPLPDSVGR